MALYLSGDRDADELLQRDPFALLIGMVLDQQVPLEKAFSSPLVLRQRLGGRLDPGAIATMPLGELEARFSDKPALHRFPKAMAERVQLLARLLMDRYDGKADEVWKRATTGEQLLANVAELPGFGRQKAQIFVALLGKQLGVRPPGWQEASGAFGSTGSLLSVADITSAESLLKVREHKAQLKAAKRSLAQATGSSPRARRPAAER